MSEEDEVFEDEIDPRIKGELDILNQSTDEINSLETELNECREKFKTSLANATQKLQKMTKKYGKAIERARPYYATKADLAQAQLALQRAVNNFHRANGVYKAAKETIALAERRLSELEDKKVDAAWQEMLNSQTTRFNEAEKDRRRSEEIHERATKRFEFLEKKLQAQRKKHKNSTTKTKDYFELKELLEIDLQKKRQKVEELQRKVDGAKKRYRQSLDNLEKISSEIHEKRRQNDKAIEALSVRQAGEGEENGGNVVDGRLPSNPLDLDLIGPSTYDNIEQLEADLDDFDLEESDDDDEEGLSSSESETESDGSTPSSGGKRHQLKRSNTAPAKQFAEAGITRRKPARMTLKRQAPVIKRASSVNAQISRSFRKDASSNNSDYEENLEFLPSPGRIATIKEDSAECSEIEDGDEKDEATYRRLHGTNINSKSSDAKPTLPPKPKKALPAPDDFDIFDELC